MEHKKDYSLLRPFDLEAAKRGDKIHWSNIPDDVAYIGVTSAGYIAYETGNESSFCSSSSFRMSPLAWVEGRPVYKGDVLYYKKEGFGISVEGYNPNIEQKTGFIGEVVTESKLYNKGHKTWAPFDCWSWTKPKQKREGWVNLYPNDVMGNYRFNSRQDATDCSSSDVIDTVKITWEE